MSLVLVPWSEAGHQKQISQTVVCGLQAFLGEVYASFFFIFVLMGMVIDKR